MQSGLGCNENMIPKKIHYCWFGGSEKPKSVEKCIASWRKFFPDYEIKEWNESNYDVYQNSFSEYCYKNKKWAFVSDFARLAIINQEGGIYFDTDVEVIKKPEFLQQDIDGFFGFETDDYIATGLGFGANKNNSLVQEMIAEYQNQKKNSEGIYILKSCPQLNSSALEKCGVKLNGLTQRIGNNLILAADYMNPYDDPTGRLNITENTFSIHWYTKSWMSRRTILRSQITRPFHRIFGVDCFEWIKKKS